MLYGVWFESHRRYNFFSILNYVCDIVVKRYTFALSSADERLFHKLKTFMKGRKFANDEDVICMANDG